MGTWVGVEMVDLMVAGETIRPITESAINWLSHSSKTAMRPNLKPYLVQGLLATLHGRFNSTYRTPTRACPVRSLPIPAGSFR